MNLPDKPIKDIVINFEDGTQMKLSPDAVVMTMPQFQEPAELLVLRRIQNEVMWLTPGAAQRVIDYMQSVVKERAAK